MTKKDIIDLVESSEYCKAAGIAGELKDTLDLIRLIDLRLIKSYHKYSYLLEKRRKLNIKYLNRCVEIQKYPRRVRGYNTIFC